MLSVGVAGLAWIVFGVAAEIGATFGVTLGLVVLFGARLLAGAAGGNIAAVQAYIADVTTPEDRTGALGLVGAAFGLGFVFGPAIGGLLAVKRSSRSPVLYYRDSSLSPRSRCRVSPQRGFRFSHSPWRQWF